MEEEAQKNRATGQIAPVISGVEADLARARSKWERSQKDLDREKQSRRAESAQTAAKIAELNRKLQTASDALEKASSKGGSVRKTWVGAISGLVAVCLVASASVWYLGSRPAAALRPDPPARTVQAYARSFPPQQPLPPQGKFTGAVSRLSQALSTVNGRAPEEVIRQLNARASRDGPVCPIEWNGGEPALVFGSGSVQSLSMNVALTRCAEAVEHLP